MAFFVVAMTSAAFGAQVAEGPYEVSGAVNGDAAAGPTADQPQTGSMDTFEYGLDWYEYDAQNDEYIVHNGSPSGPVVAEFVATPNGSNYFIQYYSATGAPAGTGTWTPR